MDRDNKISDLKDPLLNHPKNDRIVSVNEEAQSTLGNPSEGSQGSQQFATLRDLPFGQTPTQYLHKNTIAEMENAIPDSSRVKCVARFDSNLKKFKFGDEDIERLKEYNVSFEEIQKTTSVIENDVKYRPFEKKTPLCRRLGLRLLTFLVLIIVSYIGLLFVQLALFNVIMLAVVMIYLRKLFYFLHALEIKKDFSYRHSDFKKFILMENKRFYNDHSIELIGGEQGKWLEFQLPDDQEDVQNRERISKRLKQNPNQGVIYEDKAEDLHSADSFHDDQDEDDADVEDKKSN